MKAGALLAMLALSPDGPMTRRRAAATLWSHIDRPSGLARLRHVIYLLRRQFLALGEDPIMAKEDQISLRPDAVDIELVDMRPTGDPQNHAAAAFLAGLDGLDPAFDGWLKLTREALRQGALGREPPHASRDEAADPPRPFTGPVIEGWRFEALGERADEQLARALTDAVTTALARFRWFTMIVHDAVAAGAEENRSQVADYALVGRLHFTEQQCRLSLTLRALHDRGRVAWSMSSLLARPPSFADQEKLGAVTAARLEDELWLIEADRQRRLLPGDGTSRAYALVLQAIPAIYRLERAAFVRAGHLLEQAVIADRDSAVAHTWLAYWGVFFVGQGWASKRVSAMTEAGRAAERAMMLDPQDARAVTIAGHVKAFLSRRHDEATSLQELALQLNPALPLAWHLAGMTHAYAGRLEKALECVSMSLELNPNAPHGFFVEGGLGIINLLLKDHEFAVAIGRRVTERHPHFTSAFKFYLAALGHLGRHAEAAVVLRRLHALEPNFSLQRFRATSPYRNPRDIEHFVTGLRLAGLT